VKKQVVVLGTGLVGKTMAIDLQQVYEVTAVDIDKAALDELYIKHAIAVKKEDLSVPPAMLRMVKLLCGKPCLAPNW